MKLAPAVTAAATVALEDLIRQRIADRAFDDPVRRCGRGRIESSVTTLCAGAAGGG
jgi:U3 small nucleolar ribonucleoprotein component